MSKFVANISIGLEKFTETWERLSIDIDWHWELQRAKKSVQRAIVTRFGPISFVHGDLARIRGRGHEIILAISQKQTRNRNYQPDAQTDCDSAEFRWPNWLYRLYLLRGQSESRWMLRLYARKTRGERTGQIGLERTCAVCLASLKFAKLQRR